jgi:DNA-binding MarR family transcriptional regulator
MVKSKTAAAIPRLGEGARGEEGHVGYLLRQATHAHRQRVEHALADLGVTVPQFSVLTMLNAYPGISNADLARLSLLTPQTVSVIVANLERAKAIAREPHAVHGRIVHLQLTESGRRLLRACRERAVAAERLLLIGTSKGEESIIRAWLVRAAGGSGHD